ncbi:type II toxin-antitoxin system ParD family antitoxin [Devosia riboflavina]
MAISADLGATLEKVVNDLVENGRYNSKSEVLREGVRLVEEREARRNILAKLLDEAEEDIAAGRVYPAEEVFDELQALVQAKISKAS